MLRYVLRRFLLLIPMVLAASVIIFLMLRLGTGDPALDYLRLSNLPPTPEMLASTRTMLGLDQPLYVQYGTWLWKALHLVWYLIRQPTPGTGRYAELPARHAGTCRCGAGINSAHFRTARYLGGAPSRPSAGFRRTFHRVSWRVDA